MNNQDRLLIIFLPIFLTVLLAVLMWTVASIATLTMIPFYTGEGLIQSIGRGILAFFWFFITVRIYRNLTDPWRKIGL